MIRLCGIATTPYSAVKGRGGCLTGGAAAGSLEATMELEKYTERSKGFVQSAQNLALRSGHQRLTPEHLAKVLLEK